MNELKLSDFKFVGDNLRSGETVNVFHCKSGTNNDRLYITRRGNKVLAFCHHCGGKGIYNVGKSSIEETLSKVEEDKNSKVSDLVVTKDLALPSDIEYEQEKWSIPSWSWVSKYGITKQEVIDNKIGESTKLNRLVLPVFNIHDELIGYQTRRIYGKDNLPKYITYRKENNHLFMVHRSNSVAFTETCVLVEDKLSAIKCSRFLDSIWLLGTTISTDLYNFIGRNYENVIIFLDNDKTQVKEKQLKMHRILCTLMRNKVKMCYTDKDPKEYYHTELQRRLAECLV